MHGIREQNIKTEESYKSDSNKNAINFLAPNHRNNEIHRRRPIRSYHNRTETKNRS